MQPTDISSQVLIYSLEYTQRCHLNLKFYYNNQNQALPWKIHFLVLARTSLLNQ